MEQHRTPLSRNLMELRNRWVHFKIRDVYIPDPAKVLFEMYGDDLLQGRVVDLSDSGGAEGAFVVVELEGVEQPVIVPVERILGVL
jgi:hypothetical protein